MLSKHLAPTIAETRLSMAEQEPAEGWVIGSTKILWTALSLEEAQYVHFKVVNVLKANSFIRYNLRAKTRSLGTHPSILQRNDILDKRSVLLKRIMAYHQKVEALLPITSSSLVQPTLIGDEEDYILEGDDIYASAFDELHSSERLRIKMPSSLGLVYQEENKETPPHQLWLQEEKLRMGQANQALSAIRLAMGEAAVLYRLQKRATNRGNSTKTRAYEQGKKALNEVHKHWRIYNRARTALSYLPNSISSLSKYKKITAKDLTISEDIEHENRTGQRSQDIAWFWLEPDNTGQVHSSISEWHNECK